MYPWYIFFETSGVRVPEFDRGHFHFLRAAFFSQLRSRMGNILGKDEDLRITINLDGVTTYSQTSRLLTSSLSLGVPSYVCGRG